ncbi:MAG: FtsW/RodA/SpoVE family cell cycle protein [Kiritimatiellae bacterium]|nr:FtsW/RodA/SpoVE family cell cycle protein [Kiritimatiellia bacterium]
MSRAARKSPSAPAGRGTGFSAVEAAGAGAFAARMLVSWLAVALGYCAVFAGRLAWDATTAPRDLAPLGIYTACVAAEMLLLRRRALDTDLRIFEIVTFLVGVGMDVQFRMGAFSGAMSGAKLALPGGFAAMLASYALFCGGRWRHLERLSPLCYLLSLAAMASLLVFGRRFRGGLYLPGNVNPTEIAKPLLAVTLAAFLARHGDGMRRAFLGLPFPKPRSLAWLAALWLPVMALAMAVRDLGLALLLCMTLAATLAASTRRGGWLLWFAGGICAAGWIGWRLPGHVHARLAAWIDPFADPTGSGWQLLQSFSAMFAGGIWGAGIGAGLPVEVPIVATDFIYAALAEELGAVLCILVLALYAALAVRGFMGADRPGGKFGQALAAGLSAVLASQALLNLAGVVKALPLTGVVLPFLSQGGSGLVSMMLAAGLLAAVESDNG